MKSKNLDVKDFIYILPISIGLGYLMASLGYGSLVKGTFAFGFLIFLALLALVPAFRWSGGGKTLWWMIALAFTLRLVVGVATSFALPVDGYNDPDDRAGFVFTDAHNRDTQAWRLADIDKNIWEAFNKKYHTDQYGGLLAFSAVVYRYLSIDFHRPLLLILISALIAALGFPFLWKAAAQLWGEKVARISGWIFTLYPESILLGSAVMREPYLMTFSAFALWGFVDWRENHNKTAWLWLGLAFAGMLLVSPVVALITLIIFAGWLWFTREHKRISWIVLFGGLVVFMVGLFLFAWALNRTGHYGNSPLDILVNWTKEVVLWDTFQTERQSGWLQKLLDGKSPMWHVSFIAIYGMLQPVLPPAVFEPTTTTWHIIGILRALGWYTLLPVLILSFVAAAGQRPVLSEVEGSGVNRRLWTWFSLFAWIWILLTAIRAGGDQWDNPRYRAILFLWQAILAGHTLIWWRETHNPWLWRIIAMEAVFLLFFGQWYASRYISLGMQLPFGIMIALILGLWLAILVGGWWWDTNRHA
jgi:hypothetical protein